MTDHASILPRLGPKASRKARFGPGLLLIGLFLVLTLPVMLIGAGGSSEAADQDAYHLPIVRAMKDQIGTPGGVDLVNYPSATAPAYHLVLALVWWATSLPRLMWAVNLLIGGALVLALWVSLRRGVGPRIAAVLVLPLMMSPYTLGGTIWLTTDNAALLFIVLALGGAVTLPFTPGRALRLGLYAAAAVSIRQVSLWVAAPVGAFGLLASPLARFVPSAFRHEPARGGGTWAALAAGAAGALLPVALVALMVWAWGGLVPPSPDPLIRQHDAGPNFAAPAMALSLVGVYSVFFLPLTIGRSGLTRPRDLPLVLAAALGLLAACVPATGFHWPERAYGWLWTIVRAAPAPLDRSLVFAVLSPLGCMALLVFYRAARANGRGAAALLLLVSLLGWLCAQTVNTMAWQRYMDPMVLIGLAWLAAMGVPRSDGEVRSDPRWLGPMGLGAVQLLLSGVTLYREAVTDLLSR